MNLNELEALAVAIMPWKCDQAWLDTSEDISAAVVGTINEDGETYPVITVDCDQYYEGQDSLPLAKYYAAANPETILRLIELVREMGDALEWWSGDRVKEYPQAFEALAKFKELTK